MIPKWKTNEGDGAFYEPKINVKIKDSLTLEYLENPAAYLAISR